MESTTTQCFIWYTKNRGICKPGTSSPVGAGEGSRTLTRRHEPKSCASASSATPANFYQLVGLPLPTFFSSYVLILLVYWNTVDLVLAVTVSHLPLWHFKGFIWQLPTINSIMVDTSKVCFCFAQESTLYWKDSDSRFLFTVVKRSPTGYGLYLRETT